MNFAELKNLKISTKLTISACVFLLPLGIMLFTIISFSVSSINKAQNEIYGIEVMRPAVALMQSIPQYIRITVDDAPGDLEFVRSKTAENLNLMQEKYQKHFSNQGFIVSPQSLIDNWEHLNSTQIRTTVLWAYRQLMQDINKIITFVGDVSGLITDSDLESAYLIAATINELPQAQDRMVVIGNLLRTIEDGAFTVRRKEELRRNLDILIHSENVRIQNRFDAATNLKSGNRDNSESFENLLRICYDRLTYFSVTVDEVINEPEIDKQYLHVLYEAASHANNATFRLQNESFMRLESLIHDRIALYRLRLILSLAAAVFAAVFAFIIIFITTKSIRKSTDNMGKVFKQLDENNLFVNIDALSNDELGVFMKALDGFLNKLQTTFTSFSSNASMVSTAVLELSSSTKQINATANEQSSSVAEIVSTMENNKNLSAQASEKTEEVAALASHTQELSRRGAILRDVNEDMMLDIRNQNAKIIEIIINLTDMLFRIDESIKLIDSIADHTKLIAFNAALEASSSGEAGLRFSVVASEIRRFADNVVESASEIKERISELQEASNTLLSEANNGTRAIDAGYNRMVEQKEVFENIVEVSQNVANRSQQISSLSKQQEHASTQVFSALKEISLGVNQFVSATNITSSIMEKLNNMSMELKETLEKYHLTDRNNL
ncbi:MAG: methyl-accepting chemotaxis protein [Treponema sp.]|nr:methyl-accepting chemotaxis protein [Treponema sp.]